MVSKSFRKLISSSELYAARYHLGCTEHYLYGCIWNRDYQFPQWFRLLINPNPNRTLPNSTMTKKTNSPVLVPIPPSNLTYLTKSTVVVGSEIYVIGGPYDRAQSSTVRVLDCRTHTWRVAPSMKVSRNYAPTCVYNGKIYVLGGCGGLRLPDDPDDEDEPWAEVFDTKTQTWGCLPDPVIEVQSKLDIYRIEEVQGKIYIGNSKTMYAAYDTKQGKWEECCENESATFGKSECVIGNVSYQYDRNGSIHGQYMFQWYDINDKKWKEVQGLESLRETHMMNGGSRNSKSISVSCGGKLLLIWENYMKHYPNDMKKIWCAEIVLEKLNGGEVWGNVEWVDVIHSVPTSCQLMQCLSVSV